MLATMRCPKCNDELECEATEVVYNHSPSVSLVDGVSVKFYCGFCRLRWTGYLKTELMDEELPEPY